MCLQSTVIITFMIKVDEFLAVKYKNLKITTNAHNIQ